MRDFKKDIQELDKATEKLFSNATRINDVKIKQAPLKTLTPVEQLKEEIKQLEQEVKDLKEEFKQFKQKVLIEKVEAKIDTTNADPKFYRTI